MRDTHQFLLAQRCLTWQLHDDDPAVVEVDDGDPWDGAEVGSLFAVLQSEGISVLVAWA